MCQAAAPNSEALSNSRDPAHFPRNSYIQAHINYISFFP